MKEYQQGSWARALPHCEAAGKQGDAMAQGTLGAMFLRGGSGVAQNHAEAFRWTKMSGEQGYDGINRSVAILDIPKEQRELLTDTFTNMIHLHLFLMYLKGEGVAQNYPEAIRWVKKNAEKGDAAAQRYVATMYYNGEGVPKSNVLAHMWYNMAAANGDKQAVRDRSEVAAFMTEKQISEAQSRAQRCMTSNYKDC